MTSGVGAHADPAPASRPGTDAAASGDGRPGTEVAASGDGRPGIEVAFEYALVRVVPRVERGECLNAGVVVYCRATDFLRARVQLDTGALLALDPRADVEAVEAALTAVVAVCDGGDDAGPAGREPPGRRFRWLTAPRSTVVQPGPVHTGITTDPQADLDRAFTTLVKRPQR